MSSTYHPICLNHDPALIVSRDLTYEEANTLSARDGLGDHQQCDLVIGRFSYPLIEVACLGRQLPGPTGCKGYHRAAEWIDSDWLRLLAAAAPTVDHEVLRPMTGKCWPLDRLNRLRIDLRLSAPATATKTRVRPGTPPTGPAGASSANQPRCPCCYRQPPADGNQHATINPEEVTHGEHHRAT